MQCTQCCTRRQLHVYVNFHPGSPPGPANVHTGAAAVLSWAHVCIHKFLSY